MPWFAPSQALRASSPRGDLKKEIISSAAGSDMLCLSYLVGWNRGQAPRALTLNEGKKLLISGKERIL